MAGSDEESFTKAKEFLERFSVGMIRPFYPQLLDGARVVAGPDSENPSAFFGFYLYSPPPLTPA